MPEGHLTLRAIGPKGQLRLFVRSEGPDSLPNLVGAFGLSTKLGLTQYQMAEGHLVLLIINPK